MARARLSALVTDSTVDAGQAELLARYVDAFERYDIESLVALLHEEAVMSMPPMATWYAGRDAARVFLEEWAFARRWSRDRDVFEAGVRDVRLVRTSANGQPALAAYNRDPEDGLLKPYALQVLTLRDGRIAQVDGFVTPSHFPAFGLPAVLDAPDEPPDAG